MQKTNRQKILDYLEKRDNVTANELSLAFRMTAANARHHLSILLEEGVVVVTGIKTSAPNLITGNKKRGRPEQLYQLKATAQAHNLDQLAELLLTQLTALENQEMIFTTIGKQLSSGPIEGKTLSARLQQVMKKLNKMNYRARWEARADGPRIVFSHCPYLGIVDGHPELCAMDSHMLVEFLGIQVIQTAKREEIQPGVRQCVFRLKA